MSSKNISLEGFEDDEDDDEHKKFLVLNILLKQ
jgi:hypothetical protein